MRQCYLWCKNSRITKTYLQVSMLIFILILQASCGTPRPTPANTTILSHNSIVGFATINNTIYLSGSAGLLTARRAIDGGLLWNQHLPSSSSYFAASESILYDAYNDGTSALVEARQPANGRLLWSQHVPHLGPLPLVVRADAVYVNTSTPDIGTVYILRPSDGHILWHFTSGRGETMDAFLYAVNGVAAIASSDGIVHVFHAQSGTQIITYRCASDAWRPAIVSGNILVLCLLHPLQAFRVSDGILVWSSQDSDWSFNSWTVEQGVIYLQAANGSLKAFSGQNGSLLWHTSTVIGSSYSEPVVQNQLIYVLGQVGGAAYHITNGTLALSWQRPIGAIRFYPEFANTSGIVFFGPDDHTITAWRVSNGSTLWHYSTSATILWYPHTTNGMMYIRKTDGTLDAVRMNDGQILWHYAL